MSCEESGSLGRKSRTEMMSDEEVEMHVRPRRKSRESLSPAPPQRRDRRNSREQASGRPLWAPGGPRLRGVVKPRGLAQRSDDRLVGRLVAVPYNLIIPDDWSGCCCDGKVVAVERSRCLVRFQSEEAWYPTASVRRWLMPDVDPLCAALGFMSAR